MKASKRSKVKPARPIVISLDGQPIGEAKPVTIKNGQVVDDTPHTVYSTE
ncbi:hypothetical protein [Hymenobacter coalescens]